MDTFLFFTYAVFFTGLLIWSLSVAPKNNFWTLRAFIYFVLFGLIYDNAVIAVGKFIGEGDLLETLNLLRYWSHAFFTPTLALFSLGALKAAGIKSASTKLAFYGTVLFTAVLIFIEIRSGIIGLELEAVREYGVLRYSEAQPSNNLPLMILLISAILIISGLIIWISSSWAWMFVGAFIMTIGSAVPIPLESEAVTNGFELILLTFLVITKRHLDKK